MKKLFFVISLLLVSVILFSQDLPKIIPPSPNAAAFHVYGNTQVNYYTGSADITIPIFEIKEGDLTLPIYLKYTGGNGIKVEEIASWVGLGWTLNAGGAISRTIRGIADEDETKIGFFQTTEIPIPNGSNGNTFVQIEDGSRDSQADKFMYNYPGGSGSFFYNYDKSIHFKPMKDIKVSHNIGIESESVYHVRCQTYDEVITDFTVLDEYGNSFLFEDKERSNTINFGSSYTDNRGFPSTWYLSKMENLNKTREISFDYDSYVYTLKRSNSIYSVDDSGEIDTYSETTYIGKRLNTITFSQGTVEFIESTSNRKDLSNNKYLDKILVKDNEGNIIKTIKFNYQYMTPTTMKSESTTTAHAYDNRLVLTSVEECDASDNCKSPTVFTYETSQYLPSRLSKAQDHWGYYNGKSNTTLEPENYVTYYDLTESVWKYVLKGSADRNPNSTYAKAGVLKEIQYPTGGKTVFDYESHTVVDDDLPRELSRQTVNLMWKDITTSFTVDLSDAYPVTQLKVSGFCTYCTPTIYVENLSTAVRQILSLPGGVNPSEVYLKAGNYKAWFTLGCNPNDPASIMLKWDNEESSITKTVGGLRIKSLSDYSDENTLATKRNFSYTGNDTHSSGRLVNVPKYYGIIYDWNLGKPIGYDRYVRPATPLATTQGSDVGYGKVTFSYENELNGKTEQFYSTSVDFPDNRTAIDPLDGTALIEVYQGVKINHFPLPVTDSRDFLRGRLEKQINYKKSGSTYTMVSEKIFSYDHLNHEKLSPQYIQNATLAVRGLKAVERGSTYFCYYDIYTGYNLPSQTITKQYNDAGILEETSIQKYDEDANGIAEFYIPTSNEMTGSDGFTRKSTTDYVINRSSRTTAENDLNTKNAKYLPLQTDTYKNTTKLTSSYTVYDNSNSNWTGLNLPKSVKTATGTNTLEDRITYHSYDSNGNIDQVSKKDGTSIVYIWGYQKTLPIAKIMNATYSQVSSYVSNLQNLSNLDVSSSTENTLRSAQNSLRNALSNAMVTTFTYDPLVGMTSATNERGITSYFEYDEFNRRTIVKNHDAHIIQKTDYHYYNEEEPASQSLTLNKSSISFPGESSSTSVTVTSNVSWTVSDNATWLSVTPSSGSNNGSFTINVSENSGSRPRMRTCLVTVTGGGITRTINITQDIPFI